MVLILPPLMGKQRLCNSELRQSQAVVKLLQPVRGCKISSSTFLGASRTQQPGGLNYLTRGLGSFPRLCFFWVVLARFLWRNGSGSFCRTCCTRRCCGGSRCCSAGSAACSAGGSSWACSTRPSAYRWVLVLDSRANYHPQILQTEPVGKIRFPVQGRSLQSGFDS